jgi:hypothetical protein
MKNIPKKIYLQLGESEKIGEDDFNDLAEVTWCSERIYKTDIVYYLKRNNRIRTNN